MQSRFDLRKELAVSVFLGGVSLLYVCWRWGVTWENLQFPFVYVGSDDFETFVDVMNIRDTGWLWHSARLGAPFGAEFHDFPVVFLHNFDELLFKSLLFFVPNVFEVVNLVFLFTPVLSSWCAYYVLRDLGISRLFGSCGALLFAFLPFYFLRNEFHSMLTLYSFVPLAFWLCVFTYRNAVLRSFRLREMRRRDWLAVFFCLLIANNGTGYWQGFACFFLLMTALFAAIDCRRWRAGLPALRAFFVIVAICGVCLLPAVYQNCLQGRNLEVAQRSAAEVDRGGLRLTAMLLPRDFFLNSVDKKLDTYHREARNDAATYVGPVAVVGFFLLLMPVFSHRRFDDRLWLFGRLTIAGVLLAMTGGLATLASVFLAPAVLLRTCYRISIFLAFMGIWCTCWHIERLQVKRRYGSFCRWGMAGVLAASLFAQYPMDDSRDYVFTKEELPSFSPPDYARIRSEFISDRDFVQQVERLLPRGAMVYQFPYHKFPESGHIGHMFEYQLFTGFLHSKELRWSYGGMKGRPGDGWHQDVAALPLPERISRLREAGFAGIYVDCRAYDADAWKDFASQMGTLLGEEPLMSKNGNLAFWRL